MGLESIFALTSERDTEQEEAYVEDADLANMAERLLARHLTLARLRDIRIAYCLQVGKDPQQGRSREATIDTIAKAVKAPRLWESLAGWQAVVWVNEVAWGAMAERQREAVTLHELLHIDVDADSGKVVLLKHDIEEFGLVVATYGAWHGGLDRFGEQLRMFEASPVS
jgi:hypothetical protein